ncbi:hypothetical protein WN48_07572 [Eufriesea mexicana]|uniref:Uncharacterized protein n=1 Tax=Eufriesea mexicana TaxID=516756 RepID=A0A310SXF7_9HYME|nr:hypothetical protein WN48_07572 [Eufriesea mexicana]
MLVWFRASIQINPRKRDGVSRSFSSRGKVSLKENDCLSVSEESRPYVYAFCSRIRVVCFEFLSQVAGYARRGKDTVDGLAVRVDFVKVERKLRGMDVLHRYAKREKEKSGGAEKGRGRRKKREENIKGRTVYSSVH